MRSLSCSRVSLLVGFVFLTFGRAAVLQAEETAETYPYVAYVSANSARVHAGAGNAYYATDELSRGTKVEVYRDVAGWLAIAPTVNSFSWVPAKDAELTDEPDVAMILADDTPAWIGTRVDRDADHLWQVQLNQGDLVKVLAVKRRAGAGGKPESWYRIEPPVGEMRFIRAADVSREEVALADASEDEAAVEEEEPAPAEIPMAVADEARPIEPAEEEVTEPGEERSVLKAQFTARDRTRKRETVAAAPSAPRNEKPSPFKDLGESATSPRVASLERMPPTDSALLLTASSRFDDRLAELELELALLAARNPREWKLEPVRAQAERLVSTGTTTLERGRARLVLDKIGQFEALYDKALEVNDIPRTAGITSTTTASASAITPITDPTTAATKTDTLTLPEGVTYDGVGWLKPVYSAKRVAPPYALVDANGKVLQYVTPSPGLNLNRYVKKPVGIFGQKSDLPEFKAAHLTAAKVVDLTRYQK